MEVYLHFEKLTQSLWIIFVCQKKFGIQYQIYQIHKFVYFFSSEIYMFLFSESSNQHKSDLPNQQVAPSAKTVPTSKSKQSSCYPNFWWFIVNGVCAYINCHIHWLKDGIVKFFYLTIFSNEISKLPGWISCILSAPHK